jgi:hypothetical protein
MLSTENLYVSVEANNLVLMNDSRLLYKITVENDISSPLLFHTFPLITTIIPHTYTHIYAWLYNG